MIEFTVYGIPQPAGSKRAFRHPSTGKIIVTDASAKSRPWKQEVAGAAMSAMRDRPPLEGPLALTVRFYLPRPKGHYRTGKHAGQLRDNAPTWHTSRPDATKLLRAAEDALTGIVWRDDSQVAMQTVLKVYGAQALCSIVVEPLAESAALEGLAA